MMGEVEEWKEANIPHRERGAAELAFAEARGVPHFVGALSAKKIDENGEETDYGLISRRMITRNGIKALLLGFSGGFSLGNFRYHGLGTGITFEDPYDYKLSSEISSYSTGIRATGTRTEANSLTYKTVATNTVNSLTSVSEWGLFSSSAGSSGTLSVVSASRDLSTAQRGVVTIPNPGDVQAGDLLYAWIWSDYAAHAPVVSQHPGMELVSANYYGNPHGSVAGYSRIATSNEPSQYDFVLNNDWAAGVMMCVRGASKASPFSSVSDADTYDSTHSHTMSFKGQMLLYFTIILDDNYVASLPAGALKVDEFTTGGSWFGDPAEVAYGYEGLGSFSSGNRTVSWGGTGDRFTISQLVGIQAGSNAMLDHATFSPITLTASQSLQTTFELTFKPGE